MADPTVGQLADLEVNRTFAKQMMAEFKQQNIDDGITVSQAMWLHNRLNNWPCVIGGVTFNVNIVNMCVSGDIQTACLSFLYGSADDMSLPYHWLNSTRITWLTSRMKSFLGWPP